MKQLWHPRTRFSSPAALVLEPAAPALHRPANLTLGVPAVTAPASLTQWAREALDFHPFPAQSEILDCTAAHVILCCSRQFGKSTLTAIKMAHHALATREATVVVGSPSERQSGLLVDRAAAFLHHAGVRTRGYSRTTHGVRLPNGSAICALPMSERTTRGFSGVSLLIFEEAAFVPDSFYHMATPYQAAVRNPSLWLLSTPGNRSGFFFEEWIDAGRTHWRRFQVRASECPHFRPEFLAQERIRKGDSIYRREYECEFVSDATQIITRELWDSALDDDDTPFNGGKPLWND